MKLETTIDVTYNVKGTIKKQETGKLVLRITNTSWMDDFDKVGVNYKYLRPDETLVSTGSFTATNGDINAIYDAIKGSIPEGLNQTEHTKYKFYLAAQIEMSTSLEIQVSEITLDPESQQ